MKLLWILPPLLVSTLLVSGAAGEDDWGEAVNGLSCRLSIPQAEVPMGARPELTLHLRYDGPEGFVRNRHLEAGRVRLAFRDVYSGKVHHRTPDDGSCDMPEPMLPGDQETLRPGREGALVLPVRLLTKEGVQLPPGTYDVTATYEGTISSPPARMVVRPAKPAEGTFQVPSRIIFKRSEKGLCYGCEREHAASITVTVRPGYFVTMRTTYLVSIGGGEYEESGRGYGWCFGAWVFLPPERAKAVRAGGSFAVRMLMEVVESSWPQGWHHAFPSNGDHKVLWKGEIAGLMPDSER